MNLAQRNTWQNAGSLPVAVKYASTSVLDNAVILTGGWSPRTRFSKLVFSYDSESGVWKWLPPLNVGVDNHCSVVVKNELYVLGGISETGILDSVEKFDQKNWISVSSMPEPLYAMSCAVFQDIIFVVGGRGSGGEVDSIYIYNTSINQWQVSETKLPEKMHWHAAAILNNY